MPGVGTGLGDVPSDVKKGAESVAAGGTRSTSITIDIGKMLETVNIYAKDFRDGTKDLEDKVIEDVARALVTAQSLASRTNFANQTAGSTYMHNPAVFLYYYAISCMFALSGLRTRATQKGNSRLIDALLL